MINPAGELHSAIQALQHHDYDSAVGICNRVLAYYPRHVDALRLRTHAYYSLQNYEQALVDINQAIDVTPHPVLLGLRLVIFMRLKDYDRAMTDANTIIDAGTGDIMTYLNRASLHSRRQDYRAALADIEKAVAQGGVPDALLYNNRAWARTQTGDYEGALDDLQYALKLDAKLVYGYGSRGHLYFLTGKYDQALADFAKSLELKPDHTFAAAGLAITHHAAGNFEEARQCWHSLVKIDVRYASVDALVEDWYPAAAFVDEARKVVASL